MKLKRPDRNNGKGRALELEDVATFGKALVDLEAEGKVSPWVGNLLRLSLICGLRPGEARSLTWAACEHPSPNDDRRRQDWRARDPPDR